MIYYDISVILNQCLCTLDRVRLSLHLNNGAVVIVTGEEGGVYCGGHQDDSEVRVHTNHVTKNYQNEVSLVGKGLKINSMLFC